jgi:hypothetical protein
MFNVNNYTRRRYTALFLREILGYRYVTQPLSQSQILRIQAGCNYIFSEQFFLVVMICVRK